MVAQKLNDMYRVSIAECSMLVLNIQRKTDKEGVLKIMVVDKEL